MRFGNFLYLVGGNCIQPAAEAGELNEREVILPCGKFGGAVQSVVVYPLVYNPKWAGEFT